MVEIFRLSQKWDLRGVVAVSVLVSEVNFKRPKPKYSVAILERQSSDKKYVCMKKSKSNIDDIKLSGGTSGNWATVLGW